MFDNNEIMFSMHDDKKKLKIWARTKSREQKIRFWAILESVHKERQEFEYNEKHYESSSENDSDESKSDEEDQHLSKSISIKDRSKVHKKFQSSRAVNKIDMEIKSKDKRTSYKSLKMVEEIDDEPSKFSESAGKY